MQSGPSDRIELFSVSRLLHFGVRQRGMFNGKEFFCGQGWNARKCAASNVICQPRI